MGGESVADIICYKTNGQILDYCTQWDTGQQIVFKGVNTDVAPVFYFSNTIHNSSYMVSSEIVDGCITVDIPDILLQDAVPLVVYVSYVLGDDTGTTEYTVRIPVMPKSKPSTYAPDIDYGVGIGATEVINNLLSKKVTAALSAAQGPVIKSMIDNLEDTKINADEALAVIEDVLHDAIESGALQSIKGEKGEKGDPGDPGENGKDGLPGRGIVGVVRTNGDGAPGTTDTYTITYTDNTTSIFFVYNGADGEDGKDGEFSGESGADGSNGATFIPHIDSLGNLSWSNDKGLNNPDLINIMGSDGKDGLNGVSATHKWDGTVLSVTSASGTSSANLKGEDGVGITSIRQTTKSTEDDGNNVVTITMSDGTVTTVNIQNGSKGSTGDTGEQGVSISDIEQVTSSYDSDGINTFKINLTDGRSFSFNIHNGKDGIDGVQGSTGEDGVGVKSVTQTTTSSSDGGNNVITVLLTNGVSQTFNVKNGSKGSDGAPGSDAKINGVNALTINSGKGISVNQSGNTMTISSNYTYGTSDLVAGSSQLPTGQLYFVYE